MAKKKTKSTKNRVGLADQIRLGPEVAAAKKKMTPSQWRLLVKTAHSRGFTVAGQLSGVPDPLKPRLKSSIMDEAKKNVATAYAPATAELGSQEAAIKALDAKRQTDNAHFQAWLAQQQSNIATRAAAADQALASQQSGIQAQTQQGYQQAQTQAKTNAAATPGNVSDPNQATAFDFSAAANKANEMVAHQRTATAQMAQNSQARNAGYAQVGLALGAQGENSRQADTSSNLGKIRDARKKLVLDQAEAASKEIARLFGVETEKADANRNYFAAASQLGIKEQELALDVRKQSSAEKKAAAELSIKDRALDLRERTENAKIKLGYDKLVETRGQKEADRRLKKELAKTAPKGGKVTAGERNASTKQINKIGRIQTEINRLRKKGVRRPLREILTGPDFGATKTEYEIALDLADNGKLSKVNQRRAREELGIIVPSTWK